VTTTGGDPASFFAQGLGKGDAIMLLASLFYAAYTFGLRWKPAIHWMSFMWVIAVSAFIMTLPFAGWELAKGQFTLPSAKGVLVLFYVVIFPTIVSQLCWARGVELIGSNRAGLFINLVPIFGSVMAGLILREDFQWYHMAGLTLVLLGIGMSERAADNR
jgi:drug/metabolite transporter (DMT)-like permease